MCGSANLEYLAAFEWLETTIAAGCTEASAKKKLLPWLHKHVGLSEREETSRRVFNLKLKAWRDQGDSAITDRRKAANAARRAPKLSHNDLDRLSTFALEKFGGKLTPAWIQQYPNLSAEIRARYPLGHEAPAPIRRQVLLEIRRLRPWQIGPRAARLNGTYITRSWDKLFAGDVDSMDDHTLDTYTYREESPRELFRPQIFLQVDCRSGYILNFAMELEKSWTAVTALGLIRRKSEQIGQPARVNWIMTALANFNVPVALVSCPNFYAAQTRAEKLTGWNSAQFIGRIGHVERLPCHSGKIGAIGSRAVRASAAGSARG